MKSDHGRWPFFMVQLDGSTFMVRFSKYQFIKSLGPSLGVNWMWTKKNDHAQKVDVLIFLKYTPRNGSYKTNQVWPLSCLLFGFTCLHFLLNMSKDVACKSSHNNFCKKKMSDLICTCDMYLVLYVEHSLQHASSCVLEFLSSRCPTLFGETCGSWFYG
jgi:hypothetical protein